MLPRLLIVKEPERHLTYRYLTENRGSRVNTTVQLLDYAGRATVTCHLVYHDADETHPHWLVKGKQERYITSDVRDAALVRFNGMNILQATEDEIKKYINSGGTDYKYRKTDKRHKHVVRIKFIARNDKMEEICDAVISRPINNKKSVITKPLSIKWPSFRKSGKMSGGDEVILLVDKVNRKDVLVRLFELDENNQKTWSVEVPPKYIHHQCAIVFNTPEYRDPTSTDSKEVYMELVRPSDHTTSDSMTFTYRPDSQEYCWADSPGSATSSDSSLANEKWARSQESPIQEKVNVMSASNSPFFNNTVSSSAPNDTLQSSVPAQLPDSTYDVNSPGSNYNLQTPVYSPPFRGFTYDVQSTTPNNTLQTPVSAQLPDSTYDVQSTVPNTRTVSPLNNLNHEEYGVIQYEGAQYHRMECKPQPTSSIPHDMDVEEFPDVLELIHSALGIDAGNKECQLDDINDWFDVPMKTDSRRPKQTNYDTKELESILHNAVETVNDSFRELEITEDNKVNELTEELKCVENNDSGKVNEFNKELKCAENYDTDNINELTKELEGEKNNYAGKIDELMEELQCTENNDASKINELMEELQCTENNDAGKINEFTKEKECTYKDSAKVNEFVKKSTSAVEYKFTKKRGWFIALKTFAEILQEVIPYLVVLYFIF